ncbi:unnamed protein product [Heterobilharzia americana]|nr:unnamed protein product [Heterobilharzia americana]
MAASVGDDELRQALKSLGFDPGPITGTTRSVYVKKLEKLQKERKSSIASSAPKVVPQAPSQTFKPRKSVNTRTEKDNVADPMHLSAHSSNPISSRGSHVISQNQTATEKTQDNGTEEDRNFTSKSYSNTKIQSFRNNVMDLSEPYSDLFPSSPPNEPSFPKATSMIHSNTRIVTSAVSPRQQIPVRRFSRDLTQNTLDCTPARKTYIYIKEDSAAEDDTDEESEKSSPVASTLSRVAGWLNRSAHEFTKPKSPGINTDNSDIENSGRSPFFKKLYTSPLRNVKSRDAGITTSPGLLLTPPSSRRFAKSAYHDISVLSEDADTDDPVDSEKQYCQEKNVTRPLFGKHFSWNVSQIPNLILVSSICLLIVLLASYLFLKDHHGEVGKMAGVQKLLCRSLEDLNVSFAKGLHRCLREDDLTESLSVLGILYDILSRYAGEFHCKVGVLTSPRLSVSSAEGLVERNLQMKGWPTFARTSFRRVWDNTLYVLLHVGKTHFNLIAVDAAKSELGPFSRVEQIVELESLRPYFPGLCRLQRRACRIRELVAEVVYLLQNQLRENEANPNQPPYIPVHRIRDHLRQKHHDVDQLWSEIVRYVYEVETCIGVQEWRGVGETWQWQSGTGWQGSALMDKSQKPSFVVPPTECLKIRNMFSTEGIDDRGRKRIKRELLKKLIPCGPILHIGLDSVGTNGLVYVKCGDADTAGRVFHSIHANYFDGRLLTVKFLRDTKYCLRFPEAHNTKQALRLYDFE